MIKLICDKCGNDCGLTARDVTVENIHNPVPSDVLDVGSPRITDSTERKRMLLCQHCYRQTGLPNLYTVGLYFREPEERIGRWEFRGPFRGPNEGEVGTCSICQVRSRFFVDTRCPNCGAKMKTEGNETYDD